MIQISLDLINPSGARSCRQQELFFGIDLAHYREIVGETPGLRVDGGYLDGLFDDPSQG